MDGHYYQCSYCGEIHASRLRYSTEDEFIDLWCGQCETETPQLYVGKDLLEKYELYNPNLDARFFTY